MTNQDRYFSQNWSALYSKIESDNGQTKIRPIISKDLEIKKEKGTKLARFRKLSSQSLISCLPLLRVCYTTLQRDEGDARQYFQLT